MILQNVQSVLLPTEDSTSRTNLTREGFWDDDAGEPHDERPQPSAIFLSGYVSLLYNHIELRSMLGTYDTYSISKSTTVLLTSLASLASSSSL